MTKSKLDAVVICCGKRSVELNGKDGSNGR